MKSLHKIFALTLLLAGSSGLLLSQGNERNSLEKGPPPILVTTNVEPVESNLAITVEAISPEESDTYIARMVAKILEQSHFLKQDFNDEVSKRFLERYLDILDYQHIYFLQSDIADFKPFENTLDNLTLKGDTRPAYLIFNLYIKRLKQRLEFVRQALEKESFTFTSHERFRPDHHELEWPKDLEEAKKLWHDRLRFEFLQEKLNQEKPKEIVKKIIKRYERHFRSIQEYSSEQVLQTYLTALAHVYDPHSDYLGHSELENFAIQMNLSLFGIGAVLQSIDGYCTIKELVPGGPAARSKSLKPSDRIIAVAQANEEPVDVVEMNLNKVVEMIRGRKGTEVHLTVIPADAADPSVRKEVVLVREEIKLEEQEAKAKIVDILNQDGGKTRVGVIDLPSFYAEMELSQSNSKATPRSTTVDVARLLKRLIKEKVQGVILDLRRNGGGSLEEAIELTGLFIPEGPVVQVKDSRSKVVVNKDDDPKVLYDGPLIVLTSRFSASASEILAGALQDYGRAMIVGDMTTHGKGTVQQVVQLAPFFQRLGLNSDIDPGALKITVQKFYRPSGASTQLKGIVPDIILPSFNDYLEMVGEVALDNPLAWDEIPSADFTFENRVAPFLPKLKQLSQERIAVNKDFSYLQEDIAEQKRFLADKSFSLNEKERLQEKKESQERLEKRKKERSSRQKDGEIDYELTLNNVDEVTLPKMPDAAAKADLSEKEKLNSRDDKQDAEANEDEGLMTWDTVTLNEAEHILVDWIKLLDQKNHVKATVAERGDIKQ
ncbi:MAG: carboxy terminal-processing peptidase [Verrucomicrobiae bacterium]|nr:carboxy terminal-processing peptidase [Verrucomicrobiae bacterium]